VKGSLKEPSIHDNRVVAYEVDGERRRITLHTRFEANGSVEHTDIIFESVLAYYFENDNFGNVLFGVGEFSIAELVAQNRRLFEEGSQYAWPGTWNSSPEESIRYMQSAGAKAFAISSSYGLGGWVVAASCRLQQVDTHAA
jgi:hypothetical protein